MAKIHGSFSLTGPDSLASINGSILENGDAGMVFTSSATFIYNLNSYSGAAENSPDVIMPLSNAGDKRWILVSTEETIPPIDFSSFNEDIVPDYDITRSLGSATKAWKDIFVGPGSLYVNGQKVIEEASGTIILGADSDQNIQIRTGGTGDIEFLPSGTGTIELKGSLSVQSGKNLVSSDGNPISCTVGFVMNGERISDLAAPTADTDAATRGYVNTRVSNASNITTGTLPSSVLPPIAITTTQVVASQAAMLALTTQEGDVVVRTDENKSYIKNAGVSGTMTDFTALQTPESSVLSVNTQTGSVILTQDDIDDGSTYVRTTNDFTTTLLNKLDGIEVGAGANLTSSEIKTSYESNADTNAFTDALQTKLNGIEAGAEINLTNLEVKASYESNDNTNAFTDALQTKLSGIDLSLYTEKSSNLSDLSNTATARENLGLGNVVNVDTTNASNITTGTLPSSVLPPIAITTTQVASSEIEMLALTTQQGDVVVRTDENKSYIKNAGVSGTITDFTLLATPTDSVNSVNSKTGTIILTQDDVGNGSTYVRTTNDFTTSLMNRLTGIEPGATTDQTSTEILTAIKTVDGVGSGLDADLLQGKNIGSSNVGNTIVQRDVSGNFAANVITASLTGNSSTSTKLVTPRTISLIGDVTGSASFDGSSNISITTTGGATESTSKITQAQIIAYM